MQVDQEIVVLALGLAVARARSVGFAANAIAFRSRCSRRFLSRLSCFSGRAVPDPDPGSEQNASCTDDVPIAQRHSRNCHVKDY